MKSTQLLLSGLSLLVSVLAQEPSDAPATKSCTFSCPAVDSMSRPLVQRPFVIGLTSHYSIFECVYHARDEWRPLEHRCSYYKDTGLKALGATDDDCPPNAVPCSEPNSALEADFEGQPATKPKFSNLQKDEVPSWIQGGRYLLYLKEHNRRSDSD